MSGRLMLKRASGTKLYFYDLYGEGSKIQIMSSLQDWEGQDEASFHLMHSVLRRGWFCFARAENCLGGAGGGTGEVRGGD